MFNMITTVLLLMVAITGEMVSCASLGNPDELGKPDTPCSIRHSKAPGYPRDCTEAYKHCGGETAESEVIWIRPHGSPEPFEVHCNNSVDGGFWTVFQRRMDGAVEFYNNWAAYKNGFGFLQREFWLGNDKISYLTNQGDYELRIDLVNKLGDSYFAKYNLFRISNEMSLYRLVDLGAYLPESTAGFDALDYHRNMSFSTYDRDHDQRSTSCASQFHGAWWYRSCHASNLNGHYFADNESDTSIRWKGLPGGDKNLQYAEMKLRRL